MVERLEDLAAIAALTTGTLAVGFPVFITFENILFTYKNRKEDFEAQEIGEPKRPYQLEKPKLREAIRDSIRFSIGYFKVFYNPRTFLSTDGGDFSLFEDKLKEAAGYTDTN